MAPTESCRGGRNFVSEPKPETGPDLGVTEPKPEPDPDPGVTVEGLGLGLIS